MRMPPDCNAQLKIPEDGNTGHRTDARANRGPVAPSTDMCEESGCIFCERQESQQRRQVRSAMSLFTDAAKAATSYWAMLVDELKHSQRDVPQPKRYKDAINLDFGVLEGSHPKGIANIRPPASQWVRPVKGKRPIDYTWNFVCKPTKDGLIDKFKARLCARGFREVYGIHFTETHAPVTTLCSFRHCIAEAAEHDLLVELWDIRVPIFENHFLKTSISFPLMDSTPHQTMGIGG